MEDIEDDLEDSVMIKMLLVGCNGHMGHVIRNLVSDTEDVEIAAGVDAASDGKEGFPVFTSMDTCDVDSDVIVDFSIAPAVDGVLDYAVNHRVPLVECTTGLSQDQIARLNECSQSVAILRSANMSLGVNTLLKLVKTATEILGQAGFDIDIVEKHHRRKLDAPSGTALALADAANEAAGGAYEYAFDRSERRMKRPDNEIGISAVRGGTIVGQHDVIFAGTDEVVEFRHTAYSRAIFGKGAIAAARYLADKPAGLYDMQDVIG